VLWRTASVWDTTTRRALNVPPDQITLALPNAVSAASADPLTSNTLTHLTLTAHQLHTTIAADPITIDCRVI